MMLRNADGSAKHTRWFWLTAEEGLQVAVHWGKNRDRSAHLLWKQRRWASPKQRTVASIGGEFAGDGLARALNGLLTITAAQGDDIRVAADNARQRQTWLDVWTAVERVPARLAAGLAAVEAGCRTVGEVKHA